MSESILIVGASSRAAAFSALAAGLTPYCIDLFADADLARRCQVLRADDYPNGLIELARAAPPGPWMYTGALENHPDTIAAISQERPLYGNAAAVVRRVRDPAEIAKALSSIACLYPAWQPTAAGLPRDGTWLRKPLRSAGGSHIEAWNEDCLASERAAGWHFQERVAGRSASAVYVSAAGRAVLLGATEQLVGSAWTGASGFRYAGSLGPLKLSGEHRRALVELGDRLAGEFGLVGVWGVDLIFGDRNVWLIEVNPRFPASVEVLERAHGFSAVEMHMAACRDGRLPTTPSSSNSLCCGKAILYTRHQLVVDHDLAQRLDVASQIGEWPALADIPAAGTVLHAGWPILTVRQEDRDLPLLLLSLNLAAGQWQQLVER